ncbi:MAG TPA: multiheme c-type cytochrome [Lacipirellulaceae bacterium]
MKLILIDQLRMPALRWLVILLPFCVGCSRSNTSQSFTIVVSGDTAGWITPCGCASNQSGGLARRATLIAACGDAEQVLYLDAGGSAAGTSEYHELKLESILRGLRAMNLAAHNIGAAEAALAPDQLASLAEKTGVTWLSANLKPVNGQPPLDHMLVERNGVQIAVTGVIDPALVTSDAWIAREPVSAILDALGESQADLTIVLAYCDEAGLRSLAESLPEVDFIVGGPTGQAMKPATIGPVTILSATNKGKYLARIKLSPGDGDRFATDEIGPAEVTSDLAEDFQQTLNLTQYYAALAKRDFTVAEAALFSHTPRDTAEYRIAGSQACAKCHLEDDRAWHASKHSHAWEVLVAKGAHVDPFCQQCHTTGYGHEGGFTSVSQSPQLVHVGCENCHGPSSGHVADPKVKAPFLARERCIECHDHENSPNFVYDEYWPKIQHGEKKPAAIGAGG